MRRRRAPSSKQTSHPILAAGPRDPGASTTATRVREVRRLRDDDHLSWREIATRLEIASSTAVYFYRRPESSPTEEDGRRALIATLGCGGLRASEAAELDLGDIDLVHGKLHVRDSKTEAGVREVDMTPRLINEVRRYLATRPNAGREEPAFPTRTGGRRTRTTSAPG